MTISTSAINQIRAMREPAVEDGKCKMVIIETPNFSCLWECSECKVQHKATKKFYSNQSCPSCGKSISNWLGEDDD